MHSFQSVVVVEAALGSYCNQRLSAADVLAGLRRSLREICDGVRAILVHVCVSWDISGLRNVCTGPVADRCIPTYSDSIFVVFQIMSPQLTSLDIFNTVGR